MGPRPGVTNSRRTEGKITKPRRRSWTGLGYIPRYPTFTTNTANPASESYVSIIKEGRAKNETPSPDIYPLQDLNGSEPSYDMSHNDSEDSTKLDQEVQEGRMSFSSGTERNNTPHNDLVEDSTMLARGRYPTTNNYMYATSIPRPVRNFISYRSSTSSDNSARNSANFERLTRQLINSLTARNRRRAANKLAVTFGSTNEVAQVSKEVTTYGTGFDPMPDAAYLQPVIPTQRTNFADWTRYQSDQVDRFILLGNDSYFWSTPPSPVLPVPLYLPIPSPDYDRRSASLADNDGLQIDPTFSQNLQNRSPQNELVTYYSHQNNENQNPQNNNQTNVTKLVAYHSYLNRTGNQIQTRNQHTNQSHRAPSVETTSSQSRALTGHLSISNGVIRRTRNVTNVATGYVPQVAPSDGGMGCCGYILFLISWVVVVVTLPISLCLCLKVVQEYERAVIFRLGRLLPGGSKGPGLFFILPCMDSYTKVDLRTVSFDVPPQEILSKDSVTVAVDAVVYYRIQNATISVTNVEDAPRSTRLLAATTLRNVLGTKNLSEILADRENISNFMQMNLDEATDPWGVKVERVEIKDVRLPVQLQRAMAAEAEATREARAKVIAAEGEQKASRALKDAADVMMESPSAIQLRYLQTLNTISAEKNSTIIFPLPIDLIKHFLKKDD